MRTTLTAALPAAVATTLVLTATPAYAGASDLPLAIAETELARAQAAADAARYNAESPGEVTCANPDVAGASVVPPVHRPGTVSLWGKDYAWGEGHCVSLQRDRYSATLRVEVEWRNAPGKWEPVPGCASTSTVTSGDGVATPVVQPYRCDIDPAHPMATAPRRVHGYLSTTINSKVYEGYGPVYLSPTDTRAVVESGS